MAGERADPDQPTVAGFVAASAEDSAPAPLPLPPGGVWLGTPAGDHRELPPVEASAYELGPEIGGGGMGRVLIARDRRLGRLLAVKVMRAAAPEHLARFINEARITARLQHPAIVNIHEAGRLPDGRPFYAMKRVLGRPLSDVIDEAATLDERLALLPRLLTVAEALAYAHSEGVVHRDLKPSNVMIGAFGETVVLDWGLAKELAAPEPASAASSPGLWSAETVVGSVLGTPAYMPPEQAAGEPVGPRADVYAIGAMLYHVLGGAPPYRGETSTGVVEEVKRGPPPPLGASVAGLPLDLLALVERAMARDPAARYPTAQELAEDLRRFTTGQLVAAHRYSARQLVRRWLARHRAAVVVAAAALAALVATLVVGFDRVVRERDHARAARELAETQRSAAEELVGFMTFTLRDRLRDVGRLELLDGIADRVIGYYRRVGEHGELTPGQQTTRAAALLTLGDTERERGRLDGARLAYEEALRIDEQRARAAPGDAGLTRGLSVALGRVANIKALKGDLAGALADYGRDLEIATRLAAAEPDNAEYQHDLAISWQTMGDMQLRRRSFDEAERAYGSALAVLDALVAQHPAERPFQVSRALVWQALGDVASLREDRDAAVAAYQRGLDVLLPLAAAEPDNLAWRRKLSVLWNNLGDAERERGHLDAALAAFQHDLEIAVVLAGRDPDNQTYQRDLMVTRTNVADVQLGRGRAAEALVLYQEAVASTEARLARQPSNTLWQGDLAELVGKVGETELALGRPGVAREALRRAVDARARLAAQDATDSQRQLELAEAWLLFGQASRASGDRQGAHAAAAAALKLCEGLAPSGDRALADLTARARAAAAEP